MSTDYTDDEILSGIEADAPAIPAQKHVSPPPVPHADRSRLFGVLELIAVVLGSVVLTAGLTAWWLGPRDAKPTPPPTPNAVALGQSFVPKLAAALAVGFEADADSLKAGKSFGEADAALKAAFNAAKAKALEDHAGKALLSLIPEGTEIKDQAQRDQLEAFHRDFARGLREAR